VVAGGDAGETAETWGGAEGAVEPPAALRNDADISGQPVRIAQLLQINRAGMMRVEHAHAIGAAQRNIRLPADPLDLALYSAPLFVLFGEAAVVYYRRFDSALCRRDEGAANPRVAEPKHR